MSAEPVQVLPAHFLTQRVCFSLVKLFLLLPLVKSLISSHSRGMLGEIQPWAFTLHALLFALSLQKCFGSS